MLWSFNEIRGFGLRATDGEIGAVSDLLFEDVTSTVRYLVVDTGTWLQSRKVLIAPQALGEPDRSARLFPTKLTRTQVEGSPDIATNRPVSRQQEDALYAHYGWQPYWDQPVSGVAAGGTAANVAYWGRAHQEALGAAAKERQPGGAAPTQQDDPHLRSASEVIDYYIGAIDGEIGHVEDLLIDSGPWTLRYIVVDTKNWWPGKKVLVAPEWMKLVDWHNQRVSVDVTRELIKAAPAYEGPDRLDPDYEQRLYRHYGQSPRETPASA